jgi:hypothetical protein
MKGQEKAPAPPGHLTDALEKWAAETGSGQSELAQVRIDQNERLLIPFCTSVSEARIHYLEYPSCQGYLKCNGIGCLLCRIGRQVEIRDLLPVFDVIEGTVGVLPVAPSIRPHALKPQLAPILQQVKANQRVLIGVRKLDRTRHAVTSLPLPDGADDGADKIAAFLERFNAGAVDLAAIYPQLANEELAAIHEIANAMKLRGISL